LFDEKGQIKILEAFLAVGVIFVALMIPLAWPSSPSLTQQKALADMGTQALLTLDANGTLGSLITQGNWTSIKQSLDLLLPISVSFNLTVYDENSLPLNNQVIQNTNLLGSDAVSARYVCASQDLNVTFYILQLQMAQIR
jgi:hypothetical protein